MNNPTGKCPCGKDCEDDLCGECQKEAEVLREEWGEGFY